MHAHTPTRTHAVLNSLFDSLRRAQANPQCKAIVVAGANNNFSPGFDINQFKNQVGGWVGWVRCWGWVAAAAAVGLRLGRWGKLTRTGATAEPWPPPLMRMGCCLHGLLLHARPAACTAS